MVVPADGTDAAVADYESAVKALNDAQGRNDSPMPWDRFKVVSPQQKIDEARVRVRSAREELARQGVGADPAEWGLFSDDVEQTLTALAGRGSVLDPEVKVRLEQLRANMADARVAAHTGTESVVMDVLDRYREVLELQISDEAARKLVHHLPGRYRPIPQKDAVEGAVGSRFVPRYFDYVDPQLVMTTLQVTRCGPTQITLHDIVVAPASRGRGIGSAGLQHLCATADEYGLTIDGEVVQKWADRELDRLRFRKEAERQAAWFVRHGFVIDLDQAAPLYRAEIRRAPEVSIR
ncbi:Uncharacterised protein [Mycobacteroides abscessus subsp. abscessus]|uniref:GNAT family N-acetyltransferase n=1 Tax=Mycobacteroides abscessus TaxID=36809 RepID=UPI000927BCD8|nr:GNAT family N-acetyltransferase [Mycobacteroides abscessus]SHX95926.1 Uncharacterised protein [Mycobacteroides abscessus subsp. abscessus]SIC76693.1 Uncharacterised protein [Mycobacteroides abscessus subsp. abscessus]SKP28289.1 Uncharacterised protein [Mycobacteroides abscessus subsp. abscessus]